VRPQVLAAQPDHILIHQPTGRILANVRITSVLDCSVDVFWIAVKATQLETALEGISGNEAPVGAVVPLLNGIDHVGRLREFFGRRVVPAIISVESERVAPGHIIQRSPFVRFAVSDLGQSQLQSVMEKLSGFGTEYRFIANEATLMWSKLCFLAPFAYHHRCRTDEWRNPFAPAGGSDECSRAIEIVDGQEIEQSHVR